MGQGEEAQDQRERPSKTSRDSGKHPRLAPLLLLLLLLPYSEHEDEKVSGELWQAARGGRLQAPQGADRAAGIATGQAGHDGLGHSGPQTALIMCVLEDFRAGVKLLLSEGTFIGATTGLGGFSALSTAAVVGFAKLVKILLSHGASIDLATVLDGSTAPHPSLAHSPHIAAPSFQRCSNAVQLRGRTPRKISSIVKIIQNEPASCESS